VADPAPALEDKLLLSAEQSVPGERSDSILSLLNLSVVLPRSNGDSKSIVIHLLLEEGIQAAFLFSLLILKLFD